QVRRRDVAGDHPSLEDVVQAGVLGGVGRLRRGGNDAVTADDLVPRHLRLNETVIDSREGPARKAKRRARPGGTRRFEVVASAVLIHQGHLSRGQLPIGLSGRFFPRSRYFCTASTIRNRPLDRGGGLAGAAGRAPAWISASGRPARPAGSARTPSPGPPC